MWDTDDELYFIRNMLEGKTRSHQLELMNGYNAGFNLRSNWGEIRPLRVSAFVDKVISQLKRDVEDTKD